MRILLFQLWPIWLLLAIAISVILIANKQSRTRAGSEDEPQIIGLSHTGFLITCLIFGTIISGFIWLGSKLDKDTSYEHAPARLENGELRGGAAE